MAQIIELLGSFPKQVALSGKQSSTIFNRRGELRNIQKLKLWPLQNVLHEKYGFSKEDAVAASDFILLMVQVRPDKRATAGEMVQHEWLAGIDFKSGSDDDEVEEYVESERNEQSFDADMQGDEAA